MSSAAPRASGSPWAWLRAACEIAGGLAVLAGLAWFAAWETGLAYLAVAAWKRRPDVALAGAGGLALLAWKLARSLRTRAAGREQPPGPAHLPMAKTAPRQGQNCPRRMARKG